jgi:hypothetical protein
MIALLHIIAPQLLWRKGAAWQYKNPDAVQPSKAGYMAQRIGGIIVLVVGLIIILSNHK